MSEKCNFTYNNHPVHEENWKTDLLEGVDVINTLTNKLWKMFSKNNILILLNNIDGNKESEKILGNKNTNIHTLEMALKLADFCNDMLVKEWRSNSYIQALEAAILAQPGGEIVFNAIQRESSPNPTDEEITQAKENIKKIAESIGCDKMANIMKNNEEMQSFTEKKDCDNCKSSDDCHLEEHMRTIKKEQADAGGGEKEGQEDVSVLVE